MGTGAESPPPQPEKVSARHVQDSGIAFARFIADQRKTGDAESAEAIIDSLRSDNKVVADFVQRMILKTNDPEAKRLIATTAWVVFGAVTLALDPEGKVEKPER